MPPSAELRDLLALHLTPGVGPRITAALLERFGSPAAVLRASESQLRDVQYVGPKLAQSLTQAAGNPDIDAELERVAKEQVRLLVKGAPDYPASIASIPDPPLLLYVRGELTQADASAVAIVGSRQCTEYGRRIAAKLAAGLARAGATVVSGLARGIDGVAHRAALEAGGRTVAVLAGGLSRIYPPEHKGLADQTAGSGRCSPSRAWPRSRCPACSRAEPPHQRPVARDRDRGGGRGKWGAAHRASRRRTGTHRDGRAGSGRRRGQRRLQRPDP